MSECLTISDPYENVHARFILYSFWMNEFWNFEWVRIVLYKVKTTHVSIEKEYYIDERYKKTKCQKRKCDNVVQGNLFEFLNGCIPIAMPYDCQSKQ